MNLKKKIKKEIKYRISIFKENIIINYYNTNFPKNILFSYIDEPFKNKKIKNTHSNQKEALVISKIFKELEYNVDIINFTYKGEIKLEKYDIIFGFGDVFEKSFYDKSFKGKRIFYATGAEQGFQIEAELKRVKEFNKKYNSKLLLERLPKILWNNSYYLNDGVIVIGNEWTKSTWQKVYDGPIFKQVGSNIFFKECYLTKREGKEFLFMGSIGAIHKGLDLCIEAFKKLGEEYILHICTKYEKDFFEIYGQLPKNIIFHGFQNIQSSEFKNILKQCKYIIAPSCAEGQMTSLILGIGNGLIPLATKECGVDIPKKFIIEKFEVDYIVNKIKETIKLELESEGLKLQKIIRKENCIENFEINFKENFYKIVNVGR